MGQQYLQIGFVVHFMAKDGEASVVLRNPDIASSSYDPSRIVSSLHIRLDGNDVMVILDLCPASQRHDKSGSEASK